MDFSLTLVYLRSKGEEMLRGWSRGLGEMIWNFPSFFSNKIKSDLLWSIFVSVCIENSHKILTLSFSSILVSFSTVFIIFLIRLESISLALLQVQQCCNFIIPEFQVLICASSLHSETKWVTFSSIFLHILHFKESVVFLSV